MKKLFWKALIFAFVVCLSLVLFSCGDEPTVQISEDGYWVINGEKTDVKAAGEKGEQGLQGEKGEKGEKGDDGLTPTIEISDDGYWIINGEKTDVKAEGEKGEKGDKGDVGAQGSKGDTGTQGEDGKTPDFKIENGELKVSYDGGNTWTSLGTVKGEDGEDLTFTDDNPQGLDFYLKDDGTYSVGIGNAIYLSEITIPSTYNGRAVTEIGESAFEECRKLTSVTIPDSVTTIGGYAFDECESLTSIVIPDSVTSIGDHAFSWCTSLTSIVIPDSVTTIGGEYAFRGCDSLTSITVSENNTAYKDINGNLYTKDGKTLIQYAIGKTDTSFTIPDSVTTIGEYAFRGCESLTSVVIGDSVTTIGEGAFRYCGLTSIVIPDSVTTIGGYAFDGCESLTSVVIGDSVTTIGEYAFYYCDSLTDVYYMGSELEWADIIIEGGNYRLNEAIIHFNYIGE